MPTLIFTYSPKPGVPFEDLKRFLEEYDQPVTLSLPSTKSSRILRVLDDDPPFKCIEILEITNFEDWKRDTETPPDPQVKEMWLKYTNIEEINVYRCEEFYSA